MQLFSKAKLNKNNQKIILILFFISSCFSKINASNGDKGILGIGYQVSYPFTGISLIVAPDMNFAFQGMVGITHIVRDYKSYCGKIRYHFGDTDAYGYGLIGIINYESDESVAGVYKVKSKTAFGYGIGLGVESSIRNIPIWTNFEIGYGSITFNNKNYAFMVGIGLHYYLPDFAF